MLRIATSTMAALIAVLAPATAAYADTARRVDDFNGSQPGLNLKSGRFQYAEKKVVFRVRFASISKRNTMLVARYIHRDFRITIGTKWVKDEKRVTASWVGTDSYDYRRLGSRGFAADWDFRNDVITVTMDERHLEGRVAALQAWSQPKRAMHGDYRGDSLYVAKIRRG